MAQATIKDVVTSAKGVNYVNFDDGTQLEIHGTLQEFVDSQTAKIGHETLAALALAPWLEKADGSKLDGKTITFDPKSDEPVKVEAKAADPGGEVKLG